MKIAIDFREAAKPHRAGKGEYVLQLVRALIELKTDDQLILLVEPDQTFSLPSGNWRVKVVPARGLVWHLWVISWLEFIRPVQVYFSPTSLIVPAFVRSITTVVTLADFTVWRFSPTHLPKAVVLERLLMPLAIRGTNRLLAISEFTKREAIELFHVPADKINVTPLAMGPQFRPLVPIPATIVNIQRKYNLPEKFILYLGTIEPRKNIQRLIEAYQLVAHQFTDTKLVLAGGPGWFTKQILASAGDEVVTTGYIDDADRPLLYSLAVAFIFPSLYEGFGLPPLEAMAVGTPVITSRVASLPEVVNGAALLVDPTNTIELADAIKQLLSSPDLCETLRQKGLIQAQKFSWAQTAALTHQVIHRHE